ncbi:uncharacterized protein CC84DRAFT_1093676 [Paraphaeosphaeria sporulosa]|uniref:Peptidase A1 domain-containing protein n=1 Tax=Paraphaeosphaeria sporulosa TaxID=1460663 RepID=A0A177CCZ1_9PLEO|nr:uncharacterized protein CC84DRAFT_1093676 [Paraphaeosphaeria sporulosa]OAG04580.1 hypothetical protein CC84DRAFT_1093676 [Paraphaeosphaeria sporulosa]
MLFLLGISTLAVAQKIPDRNDLSNYTTGINLPYTSKFSLTKTPTIEANIEGIKFTLPVDTASTGLLIGAPQLPSIANNTGIPTYQYLAKTIYTGRFVRLNITFPGAKSTSARSEIPILIVDKSVTCPKYNTARNTGKCDDKAAPANDVSKVLILGIGFGFNLPNSGLPYAIPSHNPFLNIKEVNGAATTDKTFRSGYTVSTKGVYLGLTSANTKGYNWVKLDKGATGDSRDWAKVKTQFRVDGSAPYNGTAVVDTSTGYMYVQAEPVGSIPNTTVADTIHKPHDKNKKMKVVKPGTHLEFGFPVNKNAEGVAGFDFKVGEKKKGVPEWVFPTRAGKEPHVVAGRGLLEGFSVAFDAAGGRFGFKCMVCGEEKASETKKVKASRKITTWRYIAAKKASA